MSTPRRVVLLQLVSLAALAACGDPGGKPGAPDDTAGGDTGKPDDTGPDDTGKPDDTDSGDTDSGDTDSGDTDSGDTDSGGDPGPTTEEVCAERTDTPETCSPTSGDGEGPYFREDAPERITLNARNVAGDRLVVKGRLLDANCQPVTGAKIYFWHAGPDGRYDYMSEDPNLYGYFTTASDGYFCFDTLRPPPYTDGMGGFLPAHIHVNILVDGNKVLTTQLFFAGDPNLQEWVDPARVLETTPLASGGEQMEFDFVLSTAR